MFSVDNFYNFVSRDYGYYKTGNLIMVFLPHGSKDWHQLTPYGLDANLYLENPDLEKNSGRIIMHDQEPLFLNYIDTYRYQIQHTKNNLSTQDFRQKEQLEKLCNIPANMSRFDWLSKAIRGKKTPIICHSEQNSSDVNSLNQHGFLTCYHWWHGMIARDWFRHWRYYDDLLPKNKSNCKYRFLLYSRDHTGTRKYRKELVDHCRQYQSKTLYNWNDSHVDSTYSAKIDISDAVNSAVHIVAETLFDTEKIYLTEKVFKPMVMSQPFILFGPPKSLEYLKNYGFRTFDDIWDERYDLETDSTKRMAVLLDLIDHLAGLSESEFRNLYVKSLPIIEHNRQRFFSSEFQDHLISEMRTNINQALLEQDQRHQHSLDDKSSTDGNDV